VILGLVIIGEKSHLTNNRESGSRSRNRVVGSWTTDPIGNPKTNPVFAPIGSVTRTRLAKRYGDSAEAPQQDIRCRLAPLNWLLG